MTDQTPEEVNAKFFQEDLVEDVELTVHTGVDEYEEPIYLSKGNEVEEVDPHEIKGSSGRLTDIDLGQVSGEDSDEEEEYTSDECEDDDEDGAELDISSSSEEEMDIILKMDMVRGARSGSSSRRRLSSGKGSSVASGSAQFTLPPHTVAASGPSSVPSPLAA
ncbi:hypothetical protein Taro_042455, partial [Colocasia esculenta]|nr:hypothetical protein [Colocasia esculenta]